MEKIGKYEIVEMLGRGAMGIVFKAHDPTLDRHVAVKVMTTHMQIDEDLRARFFREAQAAGSLQHPNVITVFELGESGGQPYIAMEYVPGRDLEDIVAAEEELAVVEKVDLIEQVCRGLAYAHDRGVIHRDVKPANIRVSQLGQVKLMDFGIAHLVSAKITATGSLMGTPYYMAPEIVDGKTIDLRADIFSVGATFYELLTYTKPFEGEDLHSVFQKILHKDPRPLKKVGVDAPPMVQEVLDRSLAKHPPERYSNVGEMLNDLSEFWNTIPGDVSHARQVATTSLGRAASRGGMYGRGRGKGLLRNKAVVAAAAVVVISVAAFGLWRAVTGSSTADPTVASAETAADGAPATQPEPAAAAAADSISAAAEAADEGAPASEPTSPPVEAATPPPAQPTEDRRAAEAGLAAARSNYNTNLRATQRAREGAMAAGAASLQASLFSRADGALADARRAANAGRYETALSSLGRARRDFGTARANALNIWLARIDSARADIGGLASQASRSSPSYAEAVTHQQRALTAQEAGDYEETLRHLDMAGQAYAAAIPAPAVEPPPVAATPPAEPAPSPDEIARETLDRLRRAIEAESISELKSVWVNLSATEERNFEAFFELAEDLKVDFEVISLRSRGDRLELSVETTYDFENGGRRTNQNVRQEFELAERSGRWVIVESRD